MVISMKQKSVRLGKNIVFTVLVGLFFSAHAVVAGEVLSLKACVTLALSRNNTLRTYALERRAMAMEVKQALAPFYPSLSFGTSYSRTGHENTPRDDAAKYKFRADYNLFKGSGDWSALKAKKHGYKVSDYDLQEQSLQVVADVEKTYYALLSLKSRLSVLKKSVEASELHEKVARKRVEAEIAPRSDFLRAQVDLANARVDLVQARRDERTLKNALLVLMGRPPGSQVFIEHEPMMVVAGHKTLAELFALARKYRPSLKAFEEEIQRLTSEERALKAEFFPTLDAYAEAGEDGHHFMPDKNTWSIGISLAYPFFTGFSTRYALASARARLEAKRWAYRQEILNVQKDIADNYAQIESDEKVIQARQTLLNSALENLKVAQRRYEVGVGSIVELTDARVAATDAAIGLEVAKLIVMGDEIELKRVTGWMIPQIISEEDLKHEVEKKP